jgi:hypothetical protein
MKKIIVLLLLCFLVGCEEQLAQKPDLQNEMISVEKLSADWLDKYGDDFESRQTANIVVAIQLINRQGTVIKKLNERLDVLEDPNNLYDKLSKVNKSRVMSDFDN